MRRGGSVALLCATHATKTAILIPSACPLRQLHSKVESVGSPEAAAAPLSTRWLSDVKRRIGHCITFGLKPEQTVEAGSILEEISRNWRQLVAGSEGYLTGPKRRSMFRRPVAWGDMDSMGHGKVSRARWTKMRRTC